jgi:hypothetical protein
MHFNTEARPAEIPAYIRRVVAITGIGPWERRERDFTRQMKDNPLIERYLDTEFDIERSMILTRHHLKQTGRLPAMQQWTNNLATFYAFCAVTALAFARLRSPAQQALRQRFLGSLKDNVGLAPAAFEMRTAAHLMARGFDVDFHDLKTKGYDFLAKNDQVEMEVECKSVSGDLGRMIHLFRQYQLGPYIITSMMNPSKEGIVRLAVATLPDRLNGQREFLSSIGMRISKALSSGLNLTDCDPCSVEYSEHPIQRSPFDCPSPPKITESQVSEYCSGLVDGEIGHTIMTFSPQRSATLVALRSKKPDKFLRSLYRNLREAAASQLSGTRPGMICVQLRNLTSDQLRDVAETPAASGKPTGIQLMMAKFFGSDARSHVHSVAFVAPGDFVASQSIVPDAYGLRRDTKFGEDAICYYFVNKKNREANNPAYEIFTS